MENKKNNKKKIYILIAIVVVILICVAILCCCCTTCYNSKPNGEPTTVVSTLANGNHTEEYLPDETFDNDEKNLDWGTDWGDYENVTDANGNVIGTRKVNNNDAWNENAGGTGTKKANPTPTTQAAKPTLPTTSDGPIVLPDANAY